MRAENKLLDPPSQAIDETFIKYANMVQEEESKEKSEKKKNKGNKVLNGLDSGPTGRKDSQGFKSGGDYEDNPAVHPLG